MNKSSGQDSMNALKVLNALDILDLVRSEYSEWNSPRCEERQFAVRKTVELGHFTREDVHYQLDALHFALEHPSAREWAQKAMKTSRGTPNQAILCLNAGNLPMVGFQDLLAVLFSGYGYLGKISRQDPFLLPSFLDRLKSHTGLNVHYSTGLEELSKELPFGDVSNPQSDDLSKASLEAILFAGSQETAAQIREYVKEYFGARAEIVPALLRTAAFSVAYLDSTSRQHLEELIESMFRHQGAGCRSVAMVVSPVSLVAVGAALQEIYRERTERNERQEREEQNERKERSESTAGMQHKADATLNPFQQWMYGYHLASSHPVTMVGNLLFVESPSSRPLPGIVVWQRGGMVELEDLATTHHARIQCIYQTTQGASQGLKPSDQQKESNDSWKSIHTRFPQIQIEPLSQSQQPLVTWKPDGVDPLEWLIALKDQSRL